MALPHRLPWSEFGWQVPPWATSAESPRDPFQYQTVVTESVAPLAFIRWHQRFDSLPKLIRNYTHSRHRPIVAGQRRPIRETRPRPPPGELEQRNARCEGELEAGFGVEYGTRSLGGRFTPVVCSPANAWGKVVKQRAIADV